MLRLIIESLDFELSIKHLSYKISHHFTRSIVMVRMSKQGQRRNQFPRRRRAPSVKTGPLQDNLPNGFKQLENAIEGNFAQSMYIPKIKGR
jgi:hypothetical protein